MDAFSFGLVFVGSVGLSLLGIHALDRAGVKINGQFLSFTGEVLKYGAIGYLLVQLSKLL